MKDRLLLLVASILLLIVGPNRFHYIGQSVGGGWLARLAVIFARHPWVRNVVNWRAEYDADINRECISDFARGLYSGENLGGWGVGGKAAESRGDRHLPLSSQMRSIALSDISQEIESSSKIIVAEIGTGDGELIAFLASRFPTASFVGIDLNVSYARRTYAADNLQFIEGYAAELFENGTVIADLVFASSTFVVFPPRELERYITAITNGGVTKVVLVDPLTRKYRPEKFPNGSRHMAHGMWGHDYDYYFTKSDWNISTEIVEYKEHTKRPNILFQKVVARRGQNTGQVRTT